MKNIHTVLKQVGYILCGILLLQVETSRADIVFSSPQSAISVNGGSLHVRNALSSWDGTLDVASGLVSGAAIGFSRGTYTTSLSTGFLTGQFNPTSQTMTLSGAQRLRAHPGLAIPAVNINSVANVIEGAPNLLGPVTLSTSGAEVQLNIQSKLNQNIVLNGGSVTLLDDLALEDDVILSGSGRINFNYKSLNFPALPSIWTGNLLLNNPSDIKLNSRTSLSGTWSFRGSSVLNGNGNVLDLTSGGTLYIQSASNLQITDAHIKGLGAGLGRLSFQDTTASVSLANCTLEFSASYTLTTGGLYVLGDKCTFITGTNTFFLTQNASMTVDKVTLLADALSATATVNISPNIPNVLNLVYSNNGIIKAANAGGGDTPLSIATSNAVAGLLVAVSNATVATNNLAIANSNAIVGWIKDTSNVAAGLVVENSYAIVSAKQLAIDDSNALVSWGVATSNAVAGLLVAVSNATVAGQNFNVANSNAIVTINTLNLANSYAIVNVSNLAISTSNALLALSAALMTSNSLAIDNSNAIVGWVRDTSNAVAGLVVANSYAIVAAKQLAVANSTAITGWIQDTSNVVSGGINSQLAIDNSNAIIGWIKDTSNAVASGGGNALAIDNSNTIVGWIRDTSNAVAGLLVAVSNATVAGQNFNVANSNAIVTINTLNLANSNAIVTINTLNTANSYAIVNVSNLAISTSNALLALSAALMSSNSLAIDNSNAIVGWVRDTSNSLAGWGVDTSNAVAGLLVAVSNATVAGQNFNVANSNAIVTINTLNLANSNAIVTINTLNTANSYAIVNVSNLAISTSNALLALSAALMTSNSLAIDNSNAIVGWVRDTSNSLAGWGVDTSNAVAGLLVAVSNATVAGQNFNVANSNAIVTINSLNNANSNAIVTINTLNIANSYAVVNVSNLAISTSNALLALSAALMSSNSLAIDNSNAIIGWVRDTSNAVAGLVVANSYAIVAAKQLAVANSTAITGWIKDTSNVVSGGINSQLAIDNSNAIVGWIKDTSNAVVAGAGGALSIANSNAIVGWIRDTSNAVAGLLVAVSNATVAGQNFNVANSNAIVTINTLNLANSYAIVNVSNLAISTSNALLALSAALMTSNSLAIDNSNAIVGWVRDTSNSLAGWGVDTSNAVAGLLVAVSNATVAGQNFNVANSNAIVTINSLNNANSNAIVTINTLNIANSYAVVNVSNLAISTSNALLALSAALMSSNSLAIDNSNAIIGWVRDTSNAVAGLLVAVSNATVGGNTLNTANSNAIVTINALNLANSSAIVNINNLANQALDELRTIDHGPANIHFNSSTITMSYAHNISPDHILYVHASGVVNGDTHMINFTTSADAIFVVDPGVTVTMQNVELRGIAPDAVSLGSGSQLLFGEGCRLRFARNVDLNTTWSFVGNATIDGAGNILNLTSADAILVADGSTLTIKDTVVTGLGDNNLRLMGSSATLNLEEAQLRLESDYSFTLGSINVNADSMLSGSGRTFAYTSPQVCTVAADATLCFDKGLTFSYDSTAAAKDRLVFADPKSSLHLNGCTIHATHTGLLLTNGTMIIDDKVIFRNEAINEAEATVLDSSLSVYVLGGGTLEMGNGIIVYQ